MELVFYVIAIMGCGEGQAPCEQVRVADARYESRDACTAATEEELMRNSDVLYPVVVAQCVPQDATGRQRLTPGEVDLPAPVPMPVADTASRT